MLSTRAIHTIFQLSSLFDAEYRNFSFKTSFFYMMTNGDQAEIASKLLYKFCLSGKELDNKKINLKRQKKKK